MFWPVLHLHTRLRVVGIVQQRERWCILMLGSWLFLLEKSYVYVYVRFV